MDRAKLKNYAPQARLDFIQTVTDRASFYGLSEKTVEPITEKGDVAVIADRVFSATVIPKRRALEARIARGGFAQTMEALAYTWFNRFVAIRFMELHGYLDHGYRVLSNPDPSKTIPEILDHAEHVVLEGLNKEKVIELKLDGAKEAALYQMLLVAQCNALHSAMPFLFERIDDETELVLPDNLLHSDSVVRKLVNKIEEDDWKEVEIIGWLYQFYIAEKKDAVIGKVIASEDIPAATQLFTPNWIVKYLVQNSLGRLWMAMHPDSRLRVQMEYYIEPTKQSPDVQTQLKATNPTNLNPEQLTLLDPATGSGHILTEAYDLFKAIYEDRGYRARDIPRLILTNNLYGLEIDDRAAQLASFALMMKARSDDRRIFEARIQPNVMAIHETKAMEAKEMSDALNVSPDRGEKEGQKGDILEDDVALLIGLFECGKTFGSLIRVPERLATKLPEMAKRIEAVLAGGGMFAQPAARLLQRLVSQGRLLAGQYDAVVTNPPYMNRKFLCSDLETLLKTDVYANYSADLYACFINRCISLCRPRGYISMITMDSWMFGGDFEAARSEITSSTTTITNAHLGPRAFDEISGEVVQTCAFTLLKIHCSSYVGAFFRLVTPKTSNEKRLLLLERANRYDVDVGFFDAFPRNSMAYFASTAARGAFAAGYRLADCAEAFTGLQTGDNPRFIRNWWEVAFSRIGFGLGSPDAATSAYRWYPYVKGSEYRKWYGNLTFVVNWENDGKEIRSHPSATVRNTSYYFLPGLAYNNIAKSFSARLVRGGTIFDQKNSMFFAKNDKYLLPTLGILHSKVIRPLLDIVAPKDFNPGSLKVLPVNPDILSDEILSACVAQLVSIAETDWNSNEISWSFSHLPWLTPGQDPGLVVAIWEEWQRRCSANRQRMKELEEYNNRFFIAAFGLQDLVSPEVPDDEITLYRPDREKDIKRLISYSVGCMTGRYSLDNPGLVYARGGNEGFDISQYKTFRADDDGIIPLFETDWGMRDETANRIAEFVGVAWPKEHMERNLRFIADSLGPTNSEQPMDTIRRYLTTGFYKHHLSVYKKRPIYWLFSSGKHRAFQCLVYLHRYNEGTLSRMRTEYVIPLQGKLASRIEHLASDIQSASATSHRKKLEKERDTRLKQQTELQTFDEKLRHYADLRITLDLDDGVKVNYGKFGDLLAEVNAVTGGSDD